MTIENQVQELSQSFENIKNLLAKKVSEIHQRELLKDIEAKRTDLERRSALFLPSKQRLEKGGKTLELGQDYEAIKTLREMREKNKIRQASLRDEMTTARAELRNAEEALNVIEAEYRDKLAAQTQLQNIIQRVKTLDSQIKASRETVNQVRDEYEEAKRQQKESSESVEKERGELEKIELSLRETRKFLQFHSADEKLQTNLPGIKKCFSMFENAENKRHELKSSWDKSIETRQKAGSVLNDRSSSLAELNHSLAVREKIFVKARAVFESSVKGKSISEWREICDKNIKRLEALDELHKKFQNVRDFEGKVKNFQDVKAQIQQETRNLNLRDVAESGRVNELQIELAKLEKRSALLKRIKDIEAVRELLQDGVPCPLCGSTSHPYVSGALIPDPQEVFNKLAETQKALDNLRSELENRQAKTSKLNEEFSSATQSEIELETQINEINAEIASDISALGLSFSQGISPFEEIDKARQKSRDALQLARNTAEAAEAAEAEMKNAEDELEKVREKREAAAHAHQNALFELQNSKTHEELLSNEVKTQDETVTSLKRELISQIMQFGYKSIPDKNPGSVIEALEDRMKDWIENARRSDVLEHELSAANSKLTNLKKNSDSLRLKRDDLLSRVKASEAERDSIQQQRIVIFASKDPDEEISRMNENVTNLRERLNERREIKNERAAKLDEILSNIHGVETEISKGREELQRYEINFNKKLLTLGFRNEDDYAAACLTIDERRELQNKLRELTQEDLELNAERENAQAKMLELQSERNLSNDDLTRELKRLKKSFDEIRLTGYNNLELEKISSKFIPEIKNLILSCGLEGIF